MSACEQDLNVWHREVPLSATARRTEKIDRSRRERELSHLLAELEKRRGRLERPSLLLTVLPFLWFGSGGSWSCLQTGHKPDEDEGNDADEEGERDLWLSTLQLAVLKSIGELEAIEQVSLFGA